uniref:Ig-like domain-containing protein n=1 Tax=Phocoena sinus TaxID=42100 RepID=A0A8C9CGH1_PHOSS
MWCSPLPSPVDRKGTVKGQGQTVPSVAQLSRGHPRRTDLELGLQPKVPHSPWKSTASLGGRGRGRGVLSPGQTNWPPCRLSFKPRLLCLFSALSLGPFLTIPHTLGKGMTVTPYVSEPETSPRLFPLSLSSENSAGQVVIGCLVQGFFPSEPPKVTWSQSGNGVSIRNFPPAQAGGLYTMSSQLTLPANQCPADKSVKCQVQHLSKSSQTVDVPCAVHCPGPCQGQRLFSVRAEKPSLSLNPPALEDLLLGSNASLTCTLSGLRDPEGATFTWNPTGGKNAIQEPPKPDSCGCFSVSSVLPGCADPWKNRQSFSCTATHPESEDFGRLVNTFRPEVHLLPPPSEELALNEMVTLTCLVRGFSPKDVLVRWLQGNQELPHEKYLTWRPLPEPNQSVPTFTVTSVLRVDAEAWKQGESFSCMVGHETLPLAFTQKTIDRLAGKPTHVNVSVVMSEVDGVCY